VSTQGVYERVFSGLRSHGTARLFTQALSWVGTVYVARTLDSRAFGAFGIALVLFNHAALVYDGTLTEALVQRAPATELQRRSIWTLLVCAGLVLAAVLLLLARPVAHLVGDPQVGSVVPAMSLVLVVTSLGVLPNALLLNSMEFNKLAKIAALQGIGTTAVTVWLAHGGAGVWALAGGAVTGAVLRTLMLNIVRPSLLLPTRQLHYAVDYFRLGGVLFADTILWRFYTSVDTFLLGRWSGSTSLGFYTLAQQVAEMPLEKISTIVNDISLPAYAQLDDNRREARRLMLETMRTHATVGFPIFWGIAAVAHLIVPVVFGAKWDSAILPLIALSLIAPVRLMGSVETPAMTGMGRARVLLQSKLLVVPCMVIAFIVGCRFGGIDGAACAWLVVFPLCYGFAFRLVLRAAGLSYAELLAAVRGPALAAAIMVGAVAACAALLSSQGIPPLLDLAIEIGVGMMAYPVGLRGVDADAYRMLRQRLGRLLGLGQAR